MTLEEEERLMLSKGNILRTGKGEKGKSIEYWDIPRNAEDFRTLKLQRDRYALRKSGQSRFEEAQEIVDTLKAKTEESHG